MLEHPPNVVASEEHATTTTTTTTTTTRRVKLPQWPDLRLSPSGMMIVDHNILATLSSALWEWVLYLKDPNRFISFTERIPSTPDSFCRILVRYAYLSNHLRCFRVCAYHLWSVWSEHFSPVHIIYSKDQIQESGFYFFSFTHFGVRDLKYPVDFLIYESKMMLYYLFNYWWWWWWWWWCAKPCDWCVGFKFY